MTKGSSRYVVGIDLGTTYTAVAVHTLGEDRPVSPGGGSSGGGRWHMAELGTRNTTIPSLVLVREDGTILIGEAAERRSVIEPDRVAREFKRRLGDSVPLLLGGSPFSAEQLTAKLLQHTLDRVSELEGGPPAAMVLTHPANWGTFKIDVLRAAVQLAGHNPRTVTFISEPEAAALAYAAHDRPPEGARVAVYDLGGGTFDVAILEDHGERYALVGDPGGVERLGGIDFDEALFRHVLGMTEGADRLDHADPSIVADLVALRQSCVAAKEALSVETDTAIAVRVGPIRDEIRVVRSEFEALIRPTLEYTTDALQYTLEAAGLTPADLHAVLLVGGSSRIPLVSQLISARLGRPVALDIHPKHAVALGAALVAAGTAPADVSPQDAPAVIVTPADAGAEATPEQVAFAPPPNGPPLAGPPPPVPPPVPVTAAAAGAPDAPPTTTSARASLPPPAAAPPGAAAPPVATPQAAAAPPTVATPPVGAPPVGAPPLQTPGPARTIAFEDASPPPPTRPSRQRWLSAVGIGAFVGAVGIVGVLALGDRDGGDTGTGTGGTTSTTTSTSVDGATTSATTGATTAPTIGTTVGTTDPAAELPPLDAFIDAVNKSEARLRRIGTDTDAVIAECTDFLANTAERYGSSPDDTDRVPPGLRVAIDLQTGIDPALALAIVNTTMRRYEACVAGDQALYETLRDEENALRKQLPS
ncbi:MAG: Hsp70 family protein [Acidimicrobiales bacterium]|nr:Hsp70 family protein [Acidimicrobiales bacterium]